MNHWRRKLVRQWIKFTIQQAGKVGEVAGETITGEEGGAESKPTASSEPQGEREERRSERTCKKKNASIRVKESRKHEAYCFFVAYKGGEGKRRRN